MRQPVAALAADVVAAAVLRDDASGLEAALGIACEGRLELVGPAESGQGSIGQRRTPSLGWVNQAAARAVLSVRKTESARADSGRDGIPEGGRFAAAAESLPSRC